MEPKTQRKTIPKFQYSDQVKTFKKSNIFSKLSNFQFKSGTKDKSDSSDSQAQGDALKKQKAKLSDAVIKRPTYQQLLPIAIRESWKNVSKQLNKQQMKCLLNSQKQNELTQMKKHAVQKLMQCKLVQQIELKKTNFQIEALQLIKFNKELHKECLEHQKIQIYKQQINQQKLLKLQECTKNKQQMKQLQMEIQIIEKRIDSIEKNTKDCEIQLQSCKIVYQERFLAVQQKRQELRMVQNQYQNKLNRFLKQKFQAQVILEQKSYISCFKKYKKRSQKCNKKQFKYQKNITLNTYTDNMIKNQDPIQLALSVYFFLRTCFIKQTYYTLISQSFSTQKIRKLYEYKRFDKYFNAIKSSNLKYKNTQGIIRQHAVIQAKGVLDCVDYSQSVNKVNTKEKEVKAQILIITKYAELIEQFLSKEFKVVNYQDQNICFLIQVHNEQKVARILDCQDQIIDPQNFLRVKSEAQFILSLK